MQGLTASSFGLIWVTLILLSFGQIFIKLGLGKDGVGGGDGVSGKIVGILKVFARPKVAVGFGLYVIGTFFWLLVLSKVPLSIAFPMFSMSYFLVVILSATILKERIAWLYAIVGLLLISVGVTCIGFSCPQKKHVAVSPSAAMTAPSTNRK